MLKRMPRRRKSNSTTDPPPPDVLVLHGLSRELVDHLVSLLGSVGLRASSATDLPSLSKPQGEKVDYYIRNCGFPLVLVSADDQNPGSNRARPNVYDELARCRAHRRKDTLIIQEIRSGTPIELPSNVSGRFVVIQFDRTALHTLAPPLLSEIRSRHLVKVVAASETTVEAGGILNDFLDKMNDVWDNHFDEAWDEIHQHHYRAERNVALLLDQFFQQYLRVFTAVAKAKERGNRLKRVCDDAFARALTLAARAWENVADARMAEAHDVRKASRSEAQQARLRRALDTAEHELDLGKKSDIPDERIAHFRRALANIRTVRTNGRTPR
jgi:hypothetical protein